MSSKSKSTQTTTNQYGIDAYNSAKSTLPTSYSTTTGEQINQYMNPYSQNVIDVLTSQYADTAAQAQNSVDAAAQSAGAFGGSRHGVQSAVQAAQGQKDLSSMIAQLLNQNYGQALQAAQTENAASNQYGLSRASLLGQLAGNTQSTTTGTQSQYPGVGSIFSGLGSLFSGYGALRG